jgi:hypothetical protein
VDSRAALVVSRLKPLRQPATNFLPGDCHG